MTNGLLRNNVILISKDVLHVVFEVVSISKKTSLSVTISTSSLICLLKQENYAM
jgi:hypothetical protein